MHVYVATCVYSLYSIATFFFRIIQSNELCDCDGHARLLGQVILTDMYVASIYVCL